MEWKNSKILIGMPTPGVICSETCDSLDLIKMDLISKGIEAHTMRTEGVYVFKQRNIIAKKAEEMGCTHIFFLDNDMVVPGNIVSRFISLDKDIISTNYVVKAKRGKCQFTCTDRNFKRIWIKEEDAGLKKVHIAPTGTMLIKVDVLKKLNQYLNSNNLDYPAFYHSIIEVNGIKDEFGEDSHFTHYASEAGIEVWIDADLSKKVEHIGSKAFNWLDCY